MGVCYNVIACSAKQEAAIRKHLLEKGYNDIGWDSKYKGHVGYPFNFAVYPGEEEFFNTTDFVTYGTTCKVVTVDAEEFVKRDKKEEKKKESHHIGISCLGDGKVFAVGDTENNEPKSAWAICSPNDKFEFGVGAILALMRIYPESAAKAYAEFILHGARK